MKVNKGVLSPESGQKGYRTGREGPAGYEGVKRAGGVSRWNPAAAAAPHTETTPRCEFKEAMLHLIYGKHTLSHSRHLHCKYVLNIMLKVSLSVRQNAHVGFFFFGLFVHFKPGPCSHTRHHA